jgi:hypothetical protein
MAMISPVRRHSRFESGGLPRRRRTGYNWMVLQAAIGAFHAMASQNEREL